MAKTKVIYRDVAVGAEENATVAATGAMSESILQKLPPGVSPGKIITLEHNRWALDGTFDRFLEESVIAFWSTEISGADGTFTANPVITITFSKQFSSMGVSLIGEEATGEYCSQVKLQWYQGTTLKAEQEYQPNAVNYFCSKRVESYDKIVLTIEKTSVPLRRAKLDRIVFGVTRTFGMNELRAASITNQMNEGAIELPISTFKWTLDSLEDVDYLFQLKQPVEVQNNGKTLGVYYIDGSDRKSDRVYKIDCKDALGVLDDTPFSGGAYLSGISAKTLLETLCAPFTVEYADGVTGATLKGVIQSGTSRSAIQHVIFAWGVCLATDGGEVIRVFNLPSAAETIPQDRTFTGASVKTSSVVTKVSVVAHTYAASSSGDVEINGQKYTDTKTVYSVSNPDVIATDKVNVKEIKDATLVSTDIGQAAAQRVYDYYQRRDAISAKIVYDGEKLGDCVSIYTPWGTLLTGNLNKMDITLSNTVVYKAEVKS